MQQYVGPPDLHDGRVASVSHDTEAGVLVVRVEGAGGAAYDLRFDNVGSVTTKEPVGMMLYALVEVDVGTAHSKRFDFVNWDDDGDGRLSVTAESFSWVGVL